MSRPFARVPAPVPHAWCRIAAAALALCLLLPVAPARAALAGASSPTFVEDFESGLAAWATTCGSWTTGPGRDGGSAAVSSGGAENRLLHSTFFGSYGTYTVDVFLPGGGAEDSDLMIQYGASGYYYFNLGPVTGDNVFDRIEFVNDTLATRIVTTPTTLTAGVWHTITVRRFPNGVLQLDRDGVLAMTVADGNLTAPGQLVLRAWMAGVRFDNVTFDPSLPATPEPPAPGPTMTHTPNLCYGGPTPSSCAATGSLPIVFHWVPPVAPGAPQFIFRNQRTIAVVAAGESTWTSPLPATQRAQYCVSLDPYAGSRDVQCCVVTGPPLTGVQCSASEQPAPVVRWTPASGAGGYRVTRDGALIVTAGAADSFVVDLGAPPGTHAYCVTPFDSIGGVGPSCCDSGGVPVSALACAATETDPATIHWTPAPAAEAHRIDRDGTPIATVGALDSVYADVPGLGVHTYCVRALYGGAAGEPCCDVGGAVPDTFALAGWWPMEGNLDDLAGGNALTPNGAESFVPGRVGSALSLPSAPGPWAGAPDSYAIVPSGFTAGLWTYVRAENPCGSALVSCWGWNGYGWTVETACAGSSVRLIVRVAGAGVYGEFWSDGLVSLDAWHHVALRYDGTDLVLYLDGVMDHAVNMPGLDTRDANATITLGQGLNGALDEVRLFARALDPLQIQREALRLGDPPPPAAPVLVIAPDGSTCPPLVAWTDVTGETGYRIYRDRALIGTTGADETSFTEAAGWPPGPHVYQVKAVNAVGFSVATAASGTAPDPAPGTPVLDRAMVSGSMVRLLWRRPAGSPTMRVYRNGVLMGSVVGDTSFATTDPVEGTATWCLEAVNVCGTSPQRCVEVQSPCGAPSPTWARTLGGTGNDGLNAVVPAGDGGYFAVGGTSSSGAGAADLWLVKVDSLGAFVWQRTAGTTRNETGRGLARTSDGGCVAVGWLTNVAPFYNDVYLVRTDAAGALLWAREYLVGGQEYGHAVFALPGDSLLVVGVRASRLFAMKTSGTGDTLWTRYLSTTSAAGSATLGATRTADGGFAFVFRGSDGTPHVVRTDGAVIRRWEVEAMEHESIAEVPGGGFVVAGYDGDTGVQRLGPDGSDRGWVDLGVSLHAALAPDAGTIVGAGLGSCLDLTNSANVLGTARTDTAGTWLTPGCVVDTSGSVALGMAATADGGIVLAGNRTQDAAHGGVNGYLVKRDCSPPHTGDVEPAASVPTRLELGAPWPNPARGAVRFRIELPRASHARVDLVDVSGRRVRTLLDQELPAGVHTLGFRTSDPGLAAGVYFLRLDTGHARETRTLVVIR